MHKKITFLTIWFFLFSFVNISFGAIPIKKGFEASFVTQSVEKETPVISNVVEHHTRLPFFQRAKLKVATRLMERYGRNHRSEKSGLSVLSFCLGLGADIVLVLAVVVGFLNPAAATGAIAAVILAFAMGIAALVTGIIALAKRQRLKGLAIAGIVLGSEFALEFFSFLILLASGL
jgi:hypothetical protein